MGAPPGPHRRRRRRRDRDRAHRVARQGGRQGLLAGGRRGRALHRHGLGDRAGVAGPAPARGVPDRQRPRQGHRGRRRRPHLHGPPGRQGPGVARRWRRRRRRAPPRGVAPAARGPPGQLRKPVQLRPLAAPAPRGGVAPPLGRRVVAQPRRGRGTALLGLLGPHLQGVARLRLPVPRVRARARRRRQHRRRGRVRRPRAHRLRRRDRQGVEAGGGGGGGRRPDDEARPGAGAPGGRRRRGDRDRGVPRGPRRVRGLLRRAGHVLAVGA